MISEDQSRLECIVSDMRLPFPSRLDFRPMALFSAILFLAQQLEGTDIFFSLLTMLFIALFVAAFNAAGGLLYPSGAYIFFSGTLVALVGICWKVVLGEPGGSNLKEPTTTMLCYCAGMAAMGLMAFVNTRLRSSHPLVPRLNEANSLRSAAIGSLVIGVLLQFSVASATAEVGSLGATIRQFNRFPQLAIILATAYEVKLSNGRSAGNWIVYLAAAFLFAFGVIFTSKEGMFIAPVTWFVTAVAYGYRFRFSRVALGGLCVAFLLYYMVPYSQYVRTYRDAKNDRAANTLTALTYLSDLPETRRLYLASIEGQDADNQFVPHYFDKDQGFIGRLTMIAWDDALIARTDDGYVYGLLAVYNAFSNVIPRFIWNDKPFYNDQNRWGRELGVLADNDDSTGISFGPMGDAYHEAKWFGVLIVWPILIFGYFFVMDSFNGDIHYSPMALLPIMIASHVAPESALGGVIQQMTLGLVGLIIVSLVTKYFFPYAGKLLMGGDRTLVRSAPLLRVSGNHNFRNLDSEARRDEI